MKTTMMKSTHLTALAFLLLLPTYFFWNFEFCDDIGWHLKASEDLLRTGRFPTPDTYSFTASGQPWNQHSWLGSLLYYLAYSIGDREGITFFTLFLKIATAIVSYLIAFSLTQSSSRSLLVCFCVALSIHYLEPRPYIFSPLLAVAYYYLLRAVYWRLREKNPRTLRKYSLALLLLSCLWINIHGEFIVGGMMAFSIIIYEGLARIRQQSNHFTKTAIYIGLPALIGFFCNPHGLYGILYPLTAQGYPSPDWSSLCLWGKSGNVGPLQLILYGFFILSLYNSRNELSHLFGRTADQNHSPIDPYAKAQFLFSVLCIALSLLYIRMTWVLVFPILWLQSIRCENRPSQARENILSAAFVIFLLLMFPFRLLHQHPFQDPVQAIQFMKEAEIEGNLFTQLVWGGRIIHELNPQVLVFVDTRLQMYQEKIFEDYTKLCEGSPDCEELVRQYGIDYLLLPNVVPENHIVLQSGEWVRIFSSKNESLYMNSNASRDKWDKVIAYYQTKNIEFWPETGFNIVEVISNNPVWAINYCGIDSDNVESIQSTYLYLTNWFDKYRPQAWRHQMYEFLAEKLYALNFYNEAEDFISVALGSEKNCEKANYLLGMILYQKGYFVRAKDCFAKVGEKAKQDIEYQNRLLEIENQIKKLEQQG